MTTKQLTSDIKKFTGFIAPDGSTHDTIKKATDYTRELKIKQGLEKFATVSDNYVGVENGEASGLPLIYTRDLPAFLYAHKDEILTAFNPNVALRKPRTPATKKIAPTPQSAVIEATASILQ